MDKGIVCFSFDDGRKDNRKIAEFLLENSIPASFNITTGYVDGTAPKEYMPCDKEAMSIEDIRWLYCHKQFEIALHGDRHLNTAEDISEGRKKVIDWLNISDNCCIGFASPGTGLELDLLVKENELFYQKISYVRLGLRIKSRHIWRVLARKISRVLHIPFLYRFAYADTLMSKNEDLKILHSIPIMRDITYQQIKSLVTLCVKERKILVLMLHSIENNPQKQDAWSWSQDKMNKLCNYLLELRKKNKIEILTVQELYDKYNYEVK